MRETMTDSIEGVPLLSSLPIIGTLFQSHSHTLAKVELIIFITPTPHGRLTPPIFFKKYYWFLKIPPEFFMIRFLTAGESHGKGLIVILEGFPAHFPVTCKEINSELRDGKRVMAAEAGWPLKRIESKYYLVSGRVLP